VSSQPKQEDAALHPRFQRPVGHRLGMTHDEALMTEKFPNDPMADASFRLLIRALGFFRH
jgi:hypothetical protein